MSSCGGKCGCGSDCKCGSDCNGCGRHPNLGISENTTTETLITGLAPLKTYYEMSFGEENGCKCGSSCTCDPCSCK